MKSIHIGNREFKLLKIEPLAQFHIVRRIGPILGEMMPAMTAIAKRGGVDVEKMTDEEKLEQIAKFAAPIMIGLSKLNKPDAEEVLFELLRGVEMKQETGNWIRLVTGSTPAIFTVQDLDFATMMQLAGQSFGNNLSSFFAALPRQ